MFTGCSPFLLTLPVNASVVQAPTKVFNECDMTHQRLAKDLCAPAPGGLGEFPPFGVVLLFSSCH